MTTAGVVQALAQWWGARWLQASGTAYLCVNAAHILGIALLLGAMLPLDLRIVRGGASLPQLAPVALRTAAAGLALALLTGSWLFTVNPVGYLDNPAFRCKLVLLAVALGNIALQHALLRRRAGWAAPLPVLARLSAAASAVLWLGVLLAGRWIGFV